MPDTDETFDLWFIPVWLALSAIFGFGWFFLLGSPLDSSSPSSPSAAELIYMAVVSVMFGPWMCALIFAALAIPVAALLGGFASGWEHGLKARRPSGFIGALVRAAVLYGAIWLFVTLQGYPADRAALRQLRP